MKKNRIAFQRTLLISIWQAGHSTVNCRAVSDKKEIRVVLCDVSRAFDRYIWHRGLLLKLENCGITGSLLAWLVDYLRDRCQRVVLNCYIFLYISNIKPIMNMEMLSGLMKIMVIWYGTLIFT